MSNWNSKYLASLFILLASFSEFLVYNEEVFLCLCFFLFAVVFSSQASGTIAQGFSDEAASIEKVFLVQQNNRLDLVDNLKFNKIYAISILDVALIILLVSGLFGFQQLLRNVILQNVRIREKVQDVLKLSRGFELSSSLSRSFLTDALDLSLQRLLVKS